MARAIDNWQQLALAAIELGQLTRVEVRVSLSLTRDVMCCKVAGNTVEITRVELEERNFVKLYDALKEAMVRVGLENPEQFLVKPPDPPPSSSFATEEQQLAIARRAKPGVSSKPPPLFPSPDVTATELQAEFERMKLEQAMEVTRRAIADNQYKDRFRYIGLARLKNEGERYYDDPEDDPENNMAISLASIRNELLPGLAAVQGRSSRRSSGSVSEGTESEPPKATWREPRATPELELGTTVVAHPPIVEPDAPDLILEQGEEYGASKKAAS